MSEKVSRTKLQEEYSRKILTPAEKKYKAALMKKWLASQMKRLNGSDQTPGPISAEDTIGDLAKGKDEEASAGG